MTSQPSSQSQPANSSHQLDAVAPTAPSASVTQPLHVRAGMKKLASVPRFRGGKKHMGKHVPPPKAKAKQRKSAHTKAREFQYKVRKLSQVTDMKQLFKQGEARVQ